MTRALVLAMLAACAATPPPVSLSGQWPAQAGDYDEVTRAWTRADVLHGQYQEVLHLAATFLSPEWRVAHADREASQRGLAAGARDQLFAQARADAAGPYELELLVTTWDRNENDLDRGTKSVWHVVLVDDQGRQFAPIEIVRDRRPTFTVRAEFPALGDFAVPYIARFPHDAAILGPGVHHFELRMSSERGGVVLEWGAP